MGANPANICPCQEDLGRCRWEILKSQLALEISRLSEAFFLMKSTLLRIQQEPGQACAGVQKKAIPLQRGGWPELG